MRKRIAVGLTALTAGFVFLFGATGQAVAQKDKAKEPAKAVAGPPKFLYGHDLRVRPGGETDWVKANKIGIEVFEVQDEGVPAIVAISETGSIAVIPKVTPGEKKTCDWLTAHDMSVRKAGEAVFSSKTKKFGVELFRDNGSNRLLYVSETASLAFSAIPAGLVNNKGPKWHHALEPKVRAPAQAGFENAKRVGLEIFKDENTGGLIYITDIGAIAAAAAPASPPEPNKIAPPKTEYGLVLKVRAAGETDFTETTKRIGVEVFSDPNANNQLLYITEAGYVAVAPKPATFNAEQKGVTWKGAMALKARKGGVKGFEAAAKYGIEVFEDNRTGHLIFISDTGSISVLPK
ncbi:MAG: hypothetical protein C0467_19635 [Planctomycetaceae bacterium]|nr:hypothetical protein [Planctomycetaceae bacterium]